MNWTIKKKLIAGFGVIMLTMAITGVVILNMSMKSRKFAMEDMVSANKALDGAMEARINHLHTVWGTLEASMNFTPKAQADALKKLDKAKNDFQHSIGQLRQTSLAPEARLKELETLYAGLIAESEKMHKSALKKNELMEAFDKGIEAAVQKGLEQGLPARDINLLWSYAMAVNDYAAYGAPEAKADFDKFSIEIKGKFPASEAIKAAAAKGDELVGHSDEGRAVAKKFDEYGVKLDELLNSVEHGGAGQEGAEEYSKRLLTGLQSMAGNAIVLSIVFFSVGFGVALFLIIYLPRVITKSIDNAVDAARQIGEGDLTVVMESGRKDEIGRLYASMTGMIDKMRETLTGVKAAADKIAASSEQIRHSTVELSSNIADEAERSAQISASSTEMSQSTMDIARNVASMAASTSDTLKITQEGVDVVLKTVNEVREIEKAVTDLSLVLTSLGDKSREIGEIINVINDIADQTNLLALNAAIEAARAGEQGRGFAVVADEVRKLAEKTSKATTEIGQKISAIQRETEKAAASMLKSTERVEKGVGYSTKAGEVLDKILGSTSELQLMVHQIATATEEMSGVSEQISGDIDAIAAMTRDTGTSVDGLLAASNAMAQLSDDLRTNVDMFRIEGGQTDAQSRQKRLAH
jgi:methyl-accepting chemotaxis protein